MKKRKPISKLIDLIMAFAIFWLVIGDLITYHQVHVYGVDLFDTNSPFTVPKGKDDGKTASYKSAKGFDHTTQFVVLHLPFLKSENKHLSCVSEIVTWYGYLLNPDEFESWLSDSIPLRAPPSL
jgi:hypothetical protein